MVRETEKIENLEKLKLFCKEWFKAWTGNNPELLIDFYASDTYYQDLANPQGINGREHLFHYLKK